MSTTEKIEMNVVGHILPCTKKFAKKLLSLHFQKMQEPGFVLKLEDTDLWSFESIKKAVEMPVFYPGQQKERIRPGNAVDVTINKKPFTIMIDGISLIQEKLEDNYKITTPQSLLGMAILNLKKGDSNFYYVKKKRFMIRIKKIYTYEESKKIFFKKKSQEQEFAKSA